MKKTFAYGIFAVLIARHGRRCLSALAGVFAKQKLLCILTAGMLLVCNACDNGNNDNNGTPSVPQPKTYTVTFDADNGTANTTQTVDHGGKVTEPAAPTKAYMTTAGLYLGVPPTTYTFVEWQKSDGSAWDLTTDTVTADITLTAQWTVPTLIDLTAETGNNIVEKAVSYVNANVGSEYTLVLGEDVSDVAPQTLDQDDTTLTITSDGNTERKINLGSNGWFFFVGGIPDYPEYVDEYLYFESSDPRSAKLVIDGYIMLEGKTDNTMPLVIINNGGSFYLKGNAKLTGNKSSKSGGVSVEKDGTFIMEGGEISGNTLSNPVGAGGVFVEGGGTFIMKNGKITGNTAYDSPGGVNVRGSFIMEGGEISNNLNSGGANTMGSGVHVGNGSFTIHGGVIFGNVCKDSSTYYDYASGAGVYIRNSNSSSAIITFTQTGGTIYGYTEGDNMSNTVQGGNGSPKTGKGHAVYVNGTYFRDTTVTPNDSLSIVSYGNGTTESATGQWTD